MTLGPAEDDNKLSFVVGEEYRGFSCTTKYRSRPAIPALVRFGYRENVVIVATRTIIADKGGKLKMIAFSPTS